MGDTVAPRIMGGAIRRAVVLVVAAGLATGSAVGGAAGAEPAVGGVEIGATADAGADLAAEMSDAQIVAYIDRVYADLFGRGVDPSGLATWSEALRSGTPRRAVADSITGSDEFRAGLITDAYLSYLDREPDPAGLADWLQRMRAGLTIQQLEAGFVGSPEYFARSGGTNESFVQTLYWDLLGRPCAQDEFYYWLGRLLGGVFTSSTTPPTTRPVIPEQMSRDAIALGFLLSTERLSTDIDGDYQWLLGRSLDPSGQRTWVAAIQNGIRYEAVIGSIISSDEYVSNL